MRVEPRSSAAAGGTNDPEPITGTMRAMVRDKYGDTSVLHLDEVPRPLPGDHRILVRVAAAGLDGGAWHAMTGLPYLGRAIFGVRRPKSSLLGTEVAGTVVTVGQAVTGFSVGEEVFGFGRGTTSAANVVDVLPDDQSSRIPTCSARSSQQNTFWTATPRRTTTSSLP